MADQNPRGSEGLDPIPLPSEDRKHQSAILALLLTEHPIRLAMDELMLVLHGGADLFASAEAAEIAIHDLVGAGLVHQDGRFLAPTRAALYFDSLER